MKRLAEKLGENIQEWKLVGLSYDLEFNEVRGDMSKHSVVAVEKLKSRHTEYTRIVFLF